MYYCLDQCNRGFFRRDHFNYHKRTHTNERPYLCQHQGCPAAFRQQSALSRHENKHRRHRSESQTESPFANTISPSGSQDGLNGLPPTDVQLPYAAPAAPVNVHPLDAWTRSLPQALPPSNNYLSNPVGSNHSVAGNELEQLLANMAMPSLHQPATMAGPVGGGLNGSLQLASLVQLLLHCKAVLERA
jgi:hypothetical protein